MNKILLKGRIRDIQFSHKIEDVEYYRANLVSTRENGKEDIISLRFKKFTNPYKDNQDISLVGNVRTYSQKLDNNKSKVDVYVFTYFDLPLDEVESISNKVEIDGNICKMDELRTTFKNKPSVRFILANNIQGEFGQKLNSYIPCSAYGSVAEELADLPLKSNIKITGQLHSRQYKKYFNENEFEFRIAHEVVIDSFEVL